MVLLIYKRLTCCQFLGSRDTMKLMAIMMLVTFSSTVRLTEPMATPMQVVFLDFSWNLTEALMLFTLLIMDSEFTMTEGNLPALFRPGPNKRGILRIRVLEAMKALWEAASCLTSFLFLFSLVRSATPMQGTLAARAESQSLSVPITQ